MIVTIHIDVPALKTQAEGQAFGAALAEQIVECPVNEDAKIHRIAYAVPKQKGRDA